MTRKGWRREIVRRGWVWRFSAVAAALVLGQGSAPAIELTPALTEMYAMVSMPPPADDSIIVCYSFGCKRRLQLDLTDADRKRLTDIVTAGRASPEAERKALAQAMVWFDRRVGPVAGTTRRIARASGFNGGEASNFDCFDTTRNTSSLFLILQEWGLLRHHAVSDPRYRGNIFFGQFPHNTAVVIERASRREWAIDMWTRAFAEPPDVMPIEQWLSER
jgi:hypothetical protein